MLQVHPPAISDAGWDLQTQIREEVTFTQGLIIVRGKFIEGVHHA